MAKYRIAIGALAERDLRAVPFPMRRQINQRIQRLRDDPRPDGWERVGAGGEACLTLYGYELLYAVDDAAGVVTVVAVLRA
jgi:mRNA-degrading endonuclease RelE of RelBE toxin-antitoxin system